MEEINIDTLFDRRPIFPDADAKKRLELLVGLDEVKERLVKSLAVLVNPDGVHDWAKKFHTSEMSLLSFAERRPPLVILAGDVGTGKTEVASTIGDAVARQEEIGVTLFPLSLSTRGSGRVGEMTQLLSAAFDNVVNEAKKLKKKGSKAQGAIILLVDEADAIVQSRENNQMHHEDRAGVNAFIRGVDQLAEQGLPAAVILCTNRLSAVDPAVRRRSAEVFEFSRPNDVQRSAVLTTPLTEAGFTESNIETVVNETEDFTYSDLTQRLLPTIVLDAYPDKPVTFERTMEIIQKTKPTPAFKEVE
jgi:AAA+ superfamily predicted ATPase